MIESELLRPVLKYGILKERISAIFTDAIRAQELEKNGYQTQILEFIDMEHTPKNLLIRAVKTAHGKENMTIKPIKTADYKENSISKTGRTDAVISQKNDNSCMSANGNEQKESLLAMEEALNLNLTINRLLDK